MPDPSDPTLTRREALAAMAAMTLTACEPTKERRAAPPPSGGAGEDPSPGAGEGLARRGASGDRLPAVFVGHGAPLVALDPEKGGDFARLARALPTPRAVLVLSAHWYTPKVATGTEAKRPLMYDFYGFPDALYQVTYEAPGAPELARRVRELLADRGAVAEPDRALDHGVWTPLVHMYPDADVPVLQLTIPSSYDAAELFALGQDLAPLRDEGVLIVGSGNLTHNLRRMKPDGAPPEPWAEQFDAWIGGVLARGDKDALLDYRSAAPEVSTNHPTIEHFVPILVVAGAGGLGDEGTQVAFPIEGWEFGNLSRRAVTIG